MNDLRRKELQKAIYLLDNAMDIIILASEEEQEYADNIPENLQESEKCDKAVDDSCELGVIGDAVQENIDGLNEIITT